MIYGKYKFVEEDKKIGGYYLTKFKMKGVEISKTKNRKLSHRQKMKTHFKIMQQVVSFNLSDGKFSNHADRYCGLRFELYEFIERKSKKNIRSFMKNRK